MRARKKSVSTFRLLDDDLHTVSLGQRWSQQSAEGFVSEIKNGFISVYVSKGSFRTGNVRGETPCYDPKESLRLATDFWESFWISKDKVDLADETVVNVVESLPKLESVSQYITLNELTTCIKRLPTAKARGMDAVSNWELKHMCPDLQAMLQQLLNLINVSGRWPQHLTNARMHLIRKSAAPGDINSTRPICILPNVYRLWGKIMTAKCFKHLRDKIPSTLCGSVPGRSSIDLAMQLQSEAEHHIITGQPLYGASLDLHKAFNTLNRPLLGRMCSRLGLNEIWAPYNTFLNSLKRFFTLKQQWSNPIGSNTGVPEGCPLSVVMMMITTWAITEKLKCTTPDKPMSSYVDDWTLRDVSPEKLVGQLQEVTAITNKTGLHLSTSKTVAYATTPWARKRLAQCLKAQGFPSDVRDTGTNLGIQFHARNAKVIDFREKRVVDSTPKLKRLKIMPWSNTKKATMLLTGVFPSMLYGCEFHDMGLHFISHIRSQCNGAVWKDKPYLSHFLTPILSTRIIYEPWLWVLNRIFLSFSRLLCLQRQKTVELWNLAIGRPANKHTAGPITILFAHLRRLGWQMEPNFKCSTPNGLSVSLENITCGQYKGLVTTSWQEWLVPKLRVKHGLPDLVSFDITASCWHDTDPQNEGFMATLRSGGLFTNKIKAKFCPDMSPTCMLCGKEDGMTHRIFECPEAKQISQHLQCQFLLSQPRSQMLYGLFQQPQALEAYMRGLDAIRIEDLFSLPESDEPVHLFCDGSCSQPPPARKSERRAAYAVRHAKPFSHESFLVASGPLPGRKQTPFRSELFGFMMAMSVSLNSVIYTDCKSVYLGIVRMQNEGFDPLRWHSTADADLWKAAWNILNCQGRKLSVYWTKSHRSLEQAHSAHDAWCIYHNSRTDQSADINLDPLPAGVQASLDQLVEQNAILERTRNATTKYLKAVWAAHSEAEAKKAAHD